MVTLKERQIGTYLLGNLRCKARERVHSLGWSRGMISGYNFRINMDNLFMFYSRY